jgi:hypothetical protein
LSQRLIQLQAPRAASADRHSAVEKQLVVVHQLFVVCAIVHVTGLL